MCPQSGVKCKTCRQVAAKPVFDFEPITCQQAEAWDKRRYWEKGFLKERAILPPFSSLMGAGRGASRELPRKLGQRALDPPGSKSEEGCYGLL